MDELFRKIDGILVEAGNDFIETTHQDEAYKDAIARVKLAVREFVELPVLIGVD